jgi:hypothetical protein
MGDNGSIEISTRHRCCVDLNLVRNRTEKNETRKVG